MKSLPKVTMASLEAVLEKAVQEHDPATFTIGILSELAIADNQALASAIVSIVDSFFGEDHFKEKMAASCIACVVLKLINSAIETAELEEMFEETA